MNGCKSESTPGVSLMLLLTEAWHGAGLKRHKLNRPTLHASHLDCALAAVLAGHLGSTTDSGIRDAGLHCSNGEHDTPLAFRAASAR